MTLAAAIDGAFLGGVAAIISAFGTLILGLLAYRRGHRIGSSNAVDEWQRIAEEKQKLAEAWQDIARRTGAFDE